MTSFMLYFTIKIKVPANKEVKLLKGDKGAPVGQGQRRSCRERGPWRPGLGVEGCHFEVVYFG